MTIGRKTLLVIDDLKRKIGKQDFKELEDGFRIGSRILITSQFYNAGIEYYLEIPELPECSLIQILGEKVQTISKQGKSVIQQCKFSPLILSTVRNIVEQTGIEREEIYKNILDHPEDLKDRNGQSIMKRILSNLNESDRIALQKISNSKVHVYEANFLRKFIRPIRFMNLCDLSIIRYDSIPGFVRVHDLICSSVFTGEVTHDITMSLVEYLDEKHGEISTELLEQIYLCREVLIREEDKNTECHWISYALLQIAEKKERSVYRKYYKRSFKKNMGLSLILCLIDSREVYFYEMNQSESMRNEYLEKCAEEYLNAIKEMGYSKDIQAILWHHRGKSLRRCHRFEAALESFYKAIEIKPEYYSSYAQIAHLGSLKNIEKSFHDAGEKALQKLFDFWEQSPDKVPIRVLLLAIIKMRSYPTLMTKLGSDDVLVERLGDIMSAIDGSGQFYDAFVSFTTAFSYHHAHVCISLVGKIPAIRSMNSHSIDKTQWISACEALTNLIFSAEKIKIQDDNFISIVKELTFSFAEDIVEKISDWSEHKVRAMAKAYNLTGHPHKTLDFLCKYVNTYRENHWILYRKAEAELALSKSDSLETIHLATEIAESNPSAKKYLSSYYFLLAKCQEKFGNLGQAIISLQNAIKICDDSEYLRELRENEQLLKSKLSTEILR